MKFSKKLVLIDYKKYEKSDGFEFLIFSHSKCKKIRLRIGFQMIYYS